MKPSDASATNSLEGAGAIPATLRFKVPGGVILRLLFRMYGVVPLCICGAAAAVLMTAGVITDIRLIILAFIMLLIIMPGLAAFMYFFHGLRPATALNIPEHSVSIGGGKIHVTIFPHSRTEDVEECPGSVMRTFDPDGHTHYTADSSGITVWPSDARTGFLRIPYSAFEDTENFRVWLGKFRELVEKEYS